MGQVGEVWFDDYSHAYPAFAGDNINFEIIVDDGVTSYEYDGQTYYKSQTFAVKPGTASIAVTNVTYDTANGWVAKAGTWFAGTTKVMNAGSPDGDHGEFSFENGSQFTLAGFKANFEVTVNGETTAFQTLFGNTAEAGALAAAYGGTLKLMGDITVNEGSGSVTIAEGKTLILDLNGHIIQGTSGSDATIRNMGSLTINDSSVAQTGKVLGPVVDGYPSYSAIKVYPGSESIINAGNIETIDTLNIESGLLQINGGTFLDVYLTGTPSIDESEGALFYLNDYCDNSSVERTWSSIEQDVDDGDGGIIKVPYWFATVSKKGAVVENVVVTLPAASANSSWKVLVGVNEYAVANNQVTVPAGSELTLYLVAATGYEFANAAAEVEVEHDNGAVTEDADWSTTLTNLPVPELKEDVVVDPWEPEEDTDDSAKDKVAQIFGEDSPAATNITTYAEYTNLVAYIKTKTTPDSLTADQKTYIIESFKLGAKELFTAKPKIELKDALPSTEDDAEAGDWQFNVKVTQGSADDALEVAVAKVKALVKICSDLKNGEWAAPQAGNIDAAEDTTVENEIKITIKFGDGEKGFMMIRE
jgi:hypothetical protein